MHTRQVAVEVCLSSNDVILGVSGEQHPLPVYLAAGVPVVASDDEGVSHRSEPRISARGTNLPGLSYPQLKQLSRNSLEYSFLPGDSLWRNLSAGKVLAVCRNDTWRQGLVAALRQCTGR